jgi:2-polyprenyl-3-methyl-5-hydroxy-6-metoxy-1,4-benzoquinol methylase
MDYKITKRILKKVKEDYRIIAKDFSITRDKRIWEELDILVKKYVKDNQKILDIGCGNGRLFSILKDRKIDYLGIDNCTELINIAQKRYKDYSNSKFKVKDLLKIDFNKKFDLIFIIAVLQHIPSKELRLEVLKKAKKALKSDGYLIMLNWNLFQKDKIKYTEKYNALKLAGQSDLDFNDTLIPWKEFRNSYKKKSIKSKEILRYYHAFTRSEIENLLKNAGFKIEDIYYSKKGEKSSVVEGYHLCAVAKV